ncbi:hypothetical protein FRC16_002305, partial [Serendipita sp. 398]
MSLFANILLHPEVQRKVHQELDDVLPLGHFPTFSNLSSMPYLRATWNETLRISPPVPG